MVYDSQISFTLDTICPWTYLAKKRLDKALSQFRTTSPAASSVNFHLHYLPYQLYPSAPSAGEDKYEWYKNNKYQGSEEKMQMYTTVMHAEGEQEGIDFKFTGTMANTFEAHRMIYWVQENRGAEAVNNIVNSLYLQYFEHERHPTAPETLLQAAKDAGIPEDEAKAFIEDPSEALMDTKMTIREQAGNGVDSVPYVVFEGKRRDLTLIGTKEVNEYVKTLETIAKETK